MDEQGRASRVGAPKLQEAGRLEKRGKIPYNPPLSTPSTRAIWNTGDHPAMERTLILLKPDCIQRRLAGRILSRFEDKGFNIIAMKMMLITPELAKKHYAEHVQKGWYPALEGFITGGPVVAAIVEGLEA